jgi:hypothetical protein
LVAGVTLLSSCNHNFDHIPVHEKPRLEYAPQMYHSEAYEPVSQVVDAEAYPEHYNTMPGNKGMNLRVPVKGTVKRQFAQNTEYKFTEPYSVPKDCLVFAGATVKSPLTVSEPLLEDGKFLYTRYCSHCHGAEGKGDGPVSEKFMGIANLAGGQLLTVSEGHIFHVITHGKGRMLSHASQVLPEERWKIAHYVKEKLQKQ